MSAGQGFGKRNQWQADTWWSVAAVVKQVQISARPAPCLVHAAGKGLAGSGLQSVGDSSSIQITPWPPWMLEESSPDHVGDVLCGPEL